MESETRTTTDPFVSIPDLVSRLRNYPWLTTAAANGIERLREERDEARRIACRNEAALNKTMFDNPRYADPAAVAAQRGWDCFDRPYRDTVFNGDPPDV